MPKALSEATIRARALQSRAARKIQSNITDAAARAAALDMLQSAAVERRNRRRAADSVYRSAVRDALSKGAPADIALQHGAEMARRTRRQLQSVPRSDHIAELAVTGKRRSRLRLSRNMRPAGSDLPECAVWYFEAIGSASQAHLLVTSWASADGQLPPDADGQLPPPAGPSVIPREGAELFAGHWQVDTGEAQRWLAWLVNAKGEIFAQSTLALTRDSAAANLTDLAQSDLQTRYPEKARIEPNIYAYFLIVFPVSRAM